MIHIGDTCFEKVLQIHGCIRIIGRLFYHLVGRYDFPFVYIRLIFSIAVLPDTQRVPSSRAIDRYHVFFYYLTRFCAFRKQHFGKNTLLVVYPSANVATLFRGFFACIGIADN